MIERIIDWCASNRFLVFTGTAVLTLLGYLDDDGHARGRRAGHL